MSYELWDKCNYKMKLRKTEVNMNRQQHKYRGFSYSNLCYDLHNITNRKKIVQWVRHSPARSDQAGQLFVNRLPEMSQKASNHL